MIKNIRPILCNFIKNWDQIERLRIDLWVGVGFYYLLVNCRATGEPTPTEIRKSVNYD